MRIKRIHLQQVSLPLQTPFVTAHGTTKQRLTTLLTVYLNNGYSGVGELPAFTDSRYLPETQASTWLSLRQEIMPLLQHFDFATPQEVAHQLQRYLRGHQLARAAVETAVWAAYAVMRRQPLAILIGGAVRPVHVGISLGHYAEWQTLVQQVQAAIAAGYHRIKLKLTRPADVDQIVALRQLYPQLALMVDANSAFTLADLAQLKKLDQLHLQLIEQPLAADDFVEHASLQRQLKTPLCLDENIHSLADVKTAAALKSCRAINLKIARVGGLTTALAITDYCRQHGLIVWCGGMLGSGISRAFDLALASRPELTLPGDISASQRYFEQDVLTSPLTLRQGCLQLAATPGLGVQLNQQRVQQTLTREAWLG